MDTSIPTTHQQQPNEDDKFGSQLLELHDRIKILIAGDNSKMSAGEKRYALKALAFTLFALDAVPDGLLSPDVMSGLLSAGHHHYSAIDAEVMREYEEPCVVCGSDHSYAGRRDEESWYSYQVCNGCGCGYSF